MTQKPTYLGVDTETTGLDATSARICELAIIPYDSALRRIPSGHITTLIDPGIPIPPETTAIHGITDAMVREKPRFADLADLIQRTMLPPDGTVPYVIGQNCPFDLAFLSAELVRAGQPGLMATHPAIDTLALERACVKNDLSSMHQRYVGSPFEGAHRADADVEATVRVLQGQISKHSLPADSDSLLDLCVDKDRTWLDFSRKLYADSQGVACFGFGKFADQSILGSRETRDYATWMRGANFPSDTIAVLRSLLA